MYTHEIQFYITTTTIFMQGIFLPTKRTYVLTCRSFCFISSHAAKRKSFLKKFFQTVSELLSSVVGRMEALKKFLTSKDGNLK